MYAGSDPSANQGRVCGRGSTTRGLACGCFFTDIHGDGFLLSHPQVDLAIEHVNLHRPTPSYSIWMQDVTSQGFIDTSGSQATAFGISRQFFLHTSGVRGSWQSYHCADFRMSCLSCLKCHELLTGFRDAVSSKIALGSVLNMHETSWNQRFIEFASSIHH